MIRMFGNIWAIVPARVRRPFQKPAVEHELPGSNISHEEEEAAIEREEERREEDEAA